MNDVSISIPCMIGRDGIKRIHTLKLTEEEKTAFNRSANILKDLIRDLK